MESEFLKLYESMEHRAKNTSTAKHRYLYGQMDWRDHLICLKGDRGTGKTTILLQRYIEEYVQKKNDSALYVSADDLWFATHSLHDVANHLHNQGMTRLFVDEVHHLPEWQSQIKTVSDEFADIDIVYSGSSILKLERGKADLSRRQAVYNLQGLSFREFLDFEGILNVPPLSLEALFKDHRGIAREITSKTKVIPLFGKYLRSGYYPFYKSVFALYENRLIDMVNQILENDWPTVEEVTPSTIRKTRKMLMVLAESCPQVPKMNRLYAELETNRQHGLHMLEVLERAGLLASLSSEKATLKNLSSPDKVYPNNPNLMHALVANVNVGTLRETFMLNQLRGAGHDVKYPSRGDFDVDGRYLFEVGGKGKTFDQIADIENSFIAVDDTEIGQGNRIPLWMFGFLY